MISSLCGIKTSKQKTQKTHTQKSHQYREQICGCQKWGWGCGWGEGRKKSVKEVQNIYFKLEKNNSLCLLSKNNAKIIAVGGMSCNQVIVR